jgi:1-acyl-sn-glycerol-3-phosphate acyltransferase
MIRGIIYWIMASIVTFVWTFAALAVYPFVPRRQNFMHHNVHWWARFLLRFFCGVRIELNGLEQIDRSRAYIVVSNHRSYTDILVGNASLPIQFRWLAKKSLFRIPVLGFAMRAAGYIPVIRERAVSAFRSLHRTADVLGTGASVWIYPEGTRTPETELRAFKRGAFILAKDTGMPLLPVVLANTDRIFIKTFVIRPQLVRVSVLEPVSYCDFEQAGRSEREALELLMETVRDRIQGCYDGLVSGS